MSYAAIRPGFYRMNTPGSPWHAGAPGWSSAPMPGWGENPSQIGPPRLAVNGCGCSGTGSTPPPKPQQPTQDPDLAPGESPPVRISPVQIAIGVGVVAVIGAFVYFR